MRNNVLDELPEPPDVTNPVVRQALHELRKVVNSIIRRYGKPAAIHLELLCATRRRAPPNEQRYRSGCANATAERDQAAGKLCEHGVKVTREAIDRYLLWQEQNEVCIYSGETISMSQSRGGEVHVDHILPYSRCLDNSFMNKVVCFTKANKDKEICRPSSGSPSAILSGSRRCVSKRINCPIPSAAVLRRRSWILISSSSDSSTTRRRHISRAALEYLRTLFAEPHRVLCPKGSHTGTIRWLWGLNTVLREDSVNRKERTDHRHHAIDAIVIALTNQSRLQALAAAEDYYGPGVDEKRLAEPWEKFRELTWSGPYRRSMFRIASAARWPEPCTKIRFTVPRKRQASSWLESPLSR